MINELLTYTFYGNSVGAWAAALGLVILSVATAKALYWTLSNVARRVTEKTETKLDDIILDMVEEPIVVLAILAGTWLSMSTLVLPEILTNWSGKIFYIGAVLALAWMLNRVFDAIVEEYIVPWVENSESDFDDQLLPIVRRGVRISIWILATIVGLDNAGYDIGALLAGLGIGGLAFALAAQDSVANLFGGLTIFADRPFKIHDRVKVDGFEGHIREIGLRSTRLQTLDGRMVAMPNSKVANSSIENVSSEPTHRVTLMLGLTYSMTPEQMDEALQTLRELCEELEGVKAERILFDSFGDFSLNIECVYHVAKGFDHFEKRSEFNRAVLERFNSRGLDFAFPTQTLIVSREGSS